MASIGDLSINIVANTASLDKAIQAMNRLNGQMLSSSQRIERAANNIVKAFNAIGATSAKTASTVAKSSQQQTASALQVEKAINRASQALRNANSSIFQNVAAGDRQKSMLMANTNAFRSFKGQVQAGGLSTQQISVLQDKFSQRLQNTRRQANFASKSTQNFSERMTDLSKSVQVALGPLSGVAARITAITSLANRNTAGVAAFIGSFIALGAILVKSVRLGSEFEKQMFQIGAQLQTVGNDVGLTASQINDFAVELGRATLTSATAAREAASVILGFPEIARNNFKEVLNLSQDLAAVMGGDLRLNARRLARALEDPRNSLDTLRRAGVFFTDQQKDQLELLQATGRSAEAQRIILDKLSTVQGAAVGAAKGLAGAFDTLGESTKEYLETLSFGGGVISSFTKNVNDVTAVVDSMRNSQTGAIAVGETLTVVINGITSAFIFLLENMNFIITAFAVFTSIKGLLGAIKLLTGATIAVKTFTIALGSLSIVLNPLTLIIGALSIGAGILAAYSSAQDEASDSAKELNDSFKKQLDLVTDLGKRAELANLQKRELELRQRIQSREAAEAAAVVDVQTKRGIARGGASVRLSDIQSNLKSLRKELEEVEKRSKELFISGGGPSTIFKKLISEQADSLTKLSDRFFEGGKASREFNESFERFRAIVSPGEGIRKTLSELGITVEKFFESLSKEAGFKNLEEFSKFLGDLEQRLDPVINKLKDKRDELNFALSTIGVYGKALDELTVREELLSKMVEDGIGRTREHSSEILNNTESLDEQTKARIKAIEALIRSNRELEKNTILQQELTEVQDQNRILALKMSRLGSPENVTAREVALLEKRMKLEKQGLNAEQINKIIAANEELIKSQEHYGSLLAANQAITDTFTDGLYSISEALFTAEDRSEALKGAFRDLINDMINQIIKLGVINPILNEIFGSALASFNGTGKGGGGIFASIFGSILGGASSSGGGGEFGDAFAMNSFESADAGFATGGSFRVGGSGGSDSQLVAFRATPGEMVDIKRPGDKSGEKVGGDTYYIDARGIDPGQMDRLIRTIKEVNDSIEPRAIKATTNERFRNPNLFGNSRAR